MEKSTNNLFTKITSAVFAGLLSFIAQASADEPKLVKPPTPAERPAKPALPGGFDPAEIEANMKAAKEKAGPVLTEPPKLVPRPKNLNLKSEPKLLREGKLPNEDEVSKIIEEVGPILLKDPEQVSRLEFELDKLVNSYVAKLEKSVKENLTPSDDEKRITADYIEQLVKNFREIDAKFVKDKNKVLGLSIKFIEKIKANEYIYPYFKIYSDRIKTQNT
jgi:hypothetical protein